MVDVTLATALIQLSKPAALATVTWVRGSTPCKTGAKMLVFSDGNILGSIGGGYGEAKVIEHARKAISNGTSCKFKVNMSSDSEEEELRMSCGKQEVLIEVISEESSALLQSYWEKVERGIKPVLVTVVNSPENALNTLGNKLIMTVDGKAEGSLPIPQLELLARFVAKNFWRNKKGRKIRLNSSGRITNHRSNLDKYEWEVLIEPPPRQSELIILGGGHVALAVAKLAKNLGFRLVIIDDRPAYANQERFAMADRVICTEFTKELASLELGDDSYVIIATRGHSFDKACLQKVISYPVAYVGIVASPGRAQTFISECRNEGCPLELLDKVHTPIGLDLGAETLEEIALSIMAEITKIRRGATGLSLSEKRKRLSPLRTNRTGISLLKEL